MKIAVIIPTLPKNKEYLKLCVESLRATVDWDIFVVSNGDNAKPYYDDIHGITAHLHTRDQGQCNAVNIGSQLVTPDTDYIFISNDDMYYAPDWNRNLRFEQPVISPNLVEPENNNGSASPFFKYPGKGFTLEEFEKSLVDMFIDKQIAEIHDESFRDEVGFNFPVFIKKDLWQLLGGYDVAYDPWGSGSDTDLQMKVELAGVKPVRLRDVLVYHFSNKSGTFDGTHQDYWQNNWDYLQDKWGFNRDEAGSDTWYCKNMILWDKLKYHPSWEGKYEDKTSKSQD